MPGVYGECAVCFDDVHNPDDLVVLTTCGHTFHDECIRKCLRVSWISRVSHHVCAHVQVRDNCIMCRTPSTPAAIKPLYFNNADTDIVVGGVTLGFG
jgi:hypothetical protein